MELIMRNYVAGADYGEVYRLFTNMSVNPLIINKSDHNSMSVFSKWLDRHLETDYHDFMIFSTSSEQFVGFAYSYEFHELDGHCQFTVAVKPEFQKIGVGGIISIKFIKYLFTHYNLRKIYIHIYEHNVHSRECVKSFGFCLEGTLQDYRFYNGEFEDVLIYAVTREGFYAIIKQMDF